MPHAPTTVVALDRPSVDTWRWLDAVAVRLDWSDPLQTWHGCRAVLHALRDLMTVADVAAVGRALPLHLRGLWFEGWDPAGRPHGDLAIRVGSRFPVDVAEITPARLVDVVLHVAARELPDDAAARLRRAARD